MNPFKSLINYNFVTIMLSAFLLVSCGKKKLNENRDDSDQANELSEHPDTDDLNRLRSHFSKIYMSSGNRPGDFISHSGSDYTGNSNFATGNGFNNSVTYLNEYVKMVKVHAVSRKQVQIRDVLDVSQGTNNFTYSATSNFNLGEPYYKGLVPFLGEALSHGTDPSLIYHSIKTVKINFRNKITGETQSITGSYIEYFDNSPTVSYYQNNTTGFVISSMVPFISNPVLNIRNGVVTGRLIQAGPRENFTIEGIDNINF
jgi:hypothetical protein